MLFNSSDYNKHWSNKTLSELGMFNRGKSKHRPRNDIALFDGGTIPLIQTGDVKAAVLNITNHSQVYNQFGLKQSKLWPEGTLCITIAANIAETAILDYPMCFPDSVVGFTANSDESSEIFMHYIFSYIRKSIQNSASGSIQDNINLDYLTGLKFKIPELIEQEAIVRVLSVLDEKIEHNAKENNLLSEYIQSVYDYWFMQFDFPDTNGQPYRSSGGAMVFCSLLNREVPEGWETGELGEWISFSKGLSYKSSEIGDDGVPFINLNSFNLNGSYKVSGLKYYSGKYDDNDLLNVGDLVIAATDVTRNADIIGKSLVIPEQFSDFDVLMSCDVASVIPKRHLTTSYLNMLFNSDSYHEYIKYFASGTLVLHLDVDGINWYKTFLPSEDVLQKFDEIYKPIRKKIADNIFMNVELTKVRDELLPLLMNGQVKAEINEMVVVNS